MAASTACKRSLSAVTSTSLRVDFLAIFRFPFS
jgi:hypothetical protein